MLIRSRKSTVPDRPRMLPVKVSWALHRIGPVVRWMHSPLSVLVPANVPDRLSVSSKVKNVVPPAVRVPVTTKLVCWTVPLAASGGAAFAMPGATIAEMGASNAAVASR